MKTSFSSLKAYVNANVYTMDRQCPRAEAVLVKGKRIERIGTTKDILAVAKTCNAAVFDMDGKTMIPGFYDSHLHLLSYGFSLQVLDLNGCTSMENFLNKIKSFIQDNNILPGTWIQGRGWNQELFPDHKMPSIKDLDSVSTFHPMLFTRACGQMCVANSAAFDCVLNKLKGAPLPKGIDLDVYRKPTGLISGNARELFFKSLPPLGVSRIKQLIKMAGERYLAAGITSVQTDDFELVQAGPFKDILTAYFELDREQQLPVRVNKMLYLPNEDQLDDFLALGLKTGDGSDFFKIGPYKLSIDGSLGARTAALCSPYEDDPKNNGLLTMDRDRLKHLVSTAHNAGLQIAIDGIGDRTMELILDVYQDVIGKSAQNARPCIDHCQVTTPEIINRFKENHVIAGLELVFTGSDQTFVEKRLGKGRADMAYAWKSFFDNDVPVAMGSDSPVEDYNPFLGIHAAVTRNPIGTKGKAAWMPEQCIKVEQAIHAATMGSCIASFEEKNKGSLTPGKLSDIIVLDKNPFKIDPDELYSVKVVNTILNGDIIVPREKKE